MTPKQEMTLQSTLASAHFDYEKKLNVHAFFKLNDQALSEDLVQDTFIKTWKYLVRGGKIDMMKSFLYHILNDLIVDEYRKHKITSLEVLSKKGFEPSVNNSERLFNFLDGKASILLIRRLPDTYRKVMYLRYVKEMSIKEISTTTGQSKNAVTVQMHRGMKKLKLLCKAEY